MSPVPNVRTISTRGISVGGRYSRLPYRYRLPTARGIFAYGPSAKGFIAVGNLSAGFISVGNLSAGVISIGNLAAGLFTLGNLALAGLIAFGNAAIAAFSAGNVALGFAALGNYASGKYAIGNAVSGTTTYTISNFSSQLEQLKVFLDGMDAPASVRAFLGIIDLFIDPIRALPIIIAVSTVILALTLAIGIIPYRLTKRISDER